VLAAHPTEQAGLGFFDDLDLGVVFVDAQLIEGGFFCIFDVLPVVSTHSMGLLPLLLLARGRGPVLRWRCTPTVALGRGGVLFPGLDPPLATVARLLVLVDLRGGIAHELLEEPALWCA